MASIGCSAPLGQTCISFESGGNLFYCWFLIFFFLNFHVEFVLGDSQIHRDCEFLMMGAQRDGRPDRGTLIAADAQFGKKM